MPIKWGERDATVVGPDGKPGFTKRGVGRTKHLVQGDAMLTARIVETKVNIEGDEVAVASQTLTGDTQAQLDANVAAVMHMYDKSAEVIQDVLPLVAAA